MNPAQRKAQRKAGEPEPIKLASRFGMRNNSLPQLHNGEPEDEDLNRSVSSALFLNKVISGLALGNAGHPKPSPPSRSSSVTKPKAKATNMGKCVLGEGGKQPARPDSAVQKLTFKRHKKGLSLQFASETVQKIGLSASGLFAAPYTLKKTRGGPFDGVKGDGVRKHCETPGVTESEERFVNWDQVQRDLEKSVQGVPCTDVRGQLRIYHHFISDAIKSSGLPSSLLTRCQDGYERLIDDLQERYTNEVAKHQSEIISLQNSILREAEERKVLLKKIEKLSRENVEMSQACESYEGKINEFQEKLFDIASVALEDFPPSEQAWRLLNSELDYYKTWKKKAARELKITHAKEKKLIRLIHALKNRGFPVEEVYNSEVRTPVATQMIDAHQPDEFESLRLVSGKPKNHHRPGFVPSLNLSTVEPDVTSESDSEDSEQFTDADVTLRKAISDSSAHMLEDLEKSERTQGMGRGKPSELGKGVITDGGSL